MSTLSPSLAPPAAGARGRAVRWRVRLRLTIAVSVVCITVALAASLFTLNYVTSARAVQSFTGALLEPIARMIAERSQGFLEICGGSAALAADLAEAELSGLSSPYERLDAMEPIAFSLLRERPELFYVQFGDPGGSFEMVMRWDDGGLDTQRLRRDGAGVTSEWRVRDAGAPMGRIREHRPEKGDTYDPRVRPWYQGALQAPGVQWTDVYTHRPRGDAVITAARAVRGPEGTLVGVASASISLASFSTFLDGIRLRGRPARVFLVDSRGALLASSAVARGVPSPQGGSAGDRLPLLAEAGAPEIGNLAATAEFARALESRAPVSLLYESGGRRWLGVLRPIALEGGRDWIVGAVVPEDDFLGEINAGFARSAAVSVLVIGLFVGLGLLLSESIARPLRVIAEETHHLRRLEFDDRPLPDSVFEEIAEINDVFANLKTGLRGFQKYVPVKLVRMLLAEGTEPRLGGRVEELTLFFSDIRGFAAFAEANEATLAAVLGRYLQTMAETVADHGGTVDKFIGDAVMAFWNAPRAVEDHPYQAVLAAIRCREAIRALDQGDALYTRIGLHTARVVVGNFGAPERLAYTALGDGVNLAARLEGVNKEYGTQILITEETYRRLDGRIACRRIDRIAVKGRTLPTDIHEVLGEVGAVAPALLDAARVYEAALAAYLDRDFALAARLFADAERRRPGDVAAAVMRARAEQYCREPPPAWTGVFAMQSK
jgi:adenylate cyclase